ncbi:hypothetical protein D5086_005947 [Populus alba]|uniref:Uncharacterized protein n=1 Tax=Populus alba TaxID=43335 RepID=A0ACC4CKF5_POPAL
MGCICSKVSRATKYLERRVKRKETTKPAKRLVSLSKSDEVVVEVDGNANGSAARLISDQPGNDNAESTPVSYDEGEKKEKIEQVNNHQRTTSIVSMSNGERGAQVVAGWPSWLTSVAGEAINGWVPRRADSFEKLDKIKCYMQQLLHGLEHCHNRGILHRDIKGSNLLIDSNGNLKIADFGLATFFSSPQKQPLTSRVVTLWYRPPELLLGATEYGVSVDLWSTGCILAELFVGKHIMPGRTEVEQLHKIFKLCGSPSDEYWKRSKLPHATIFKPQHPYKRCVAETFKDFPSSALALLDVLLAVEPEARGTALSALDSEFFTTKPLPCDPSALPEHPPTKEFDVKFRDEDARRRRAAGGKGRGYESTRRGSKESKVVPAPDATAELQGSIQKRQGQSKQISTSEIYNHEEDGVSRSPIGPATGTARNIYSHPGQSVHPMNLGSSHNMNINETFRAPGQDFISSRQAAELRAQRSFNERGAVQLSRFSNSVAVRGDSQFHGSSSTNLNSHWPEGSFNARYNSLDDSSHGQSDRPNFSNKKPGLDSTTLLRSDTGSFKIHESVNLSDVLAKLIPCIPCFRTETLNGCSETSLLLGTFCRRVLITRSFCLWPQGYSTKIGHVHYSGPLVPQGGNIEEMLKEHEKQIQRAVRKARLDKNTGESGHTESLFYHGRINGR